jgi:hypothetical protein
MRNSRVGDRATAIKFFNQAVESSNDKSNTVNITTAYQLFVAAAYADPTYWQSFYQSGNNNSDLNHFPSAIACWRRAMECDLKDDERAKVYANLSQRLHSIGKVTEALGYAEQSVALDPKLSGGWVNLSIIYGTLSREADSLRAAERAYQLAPDDETSQMALSFALLFDGQLARGFAEFECRYRYALHSFTQFPYPRWKGEENATVYMVADQGLGDTLSFARFIPMVAKRSRFVHLAVQGELTRAFQHAFAAYPNVDVIPLHPHFRQADYWSTFVSIPFALKLSDEEIRNTPPVELPVFSPNPSWQRVTDRKLHIGIAWTGSAANQINAHRSIPITQFLELYRVPGIQLYGLQIGPEHKQLYETGCAPVITDLSPYVRDVVDTVSFLTKLDLVICCESALTHICAAVGRECWVPYSYLGRDYRLGHRGRHMMWMPQARVFPQEEGETWEPVFERVIAALREKVDGLG